MATGKVKFFDPVKNFGFIIPDNGEGNVFVYKDNVIGDPITKDDLVEYEMGKNDKNGRDEAKDVRKIAA